MTSAVIYPWIRGVHITSALIFIIGVSALSLLLISGPPDSAARRSAALAMRRWNRRLTTPAMLLTWGLGFVLATEGHWLGDEWLHVKLCSVVVLSAIHGIQCRSLALRVQGLDGGIWRLTPLFVASTTLAILVLAVVKPF